MQPRPRRTRSGTTGMDPADRCRHRTLDESTKPLYADVRCRSRSRTFQPWFRTMRNAISVAAVFATLVLAPEVGACGEEAPLRITLFQADVTPPLGAPLCDALVPPAKEIVDK